MPTITLSIGGKSEAAAANSGASKPRRRQNSQPGETAFGLSRDFIENRFVYLVLSARAHGLSVGINMNPDKHCNFNCVYCEVNRTMSSGEHQLDVEAMSAELHRTLAFIQSGQIRLFPRYSTVPPELMQLRHVALSGDGEPTLCPNFMEAVQSVVHVRARANCPFFKIVLITNGAGLDLPVVQAGLKSFTSQDEVWVKLDAGTQGYMDKINRPDISLEKVMANIVMLGRQRPVVIQSLFPLYNGEAPSESEIEEYVQRLRELKAGGTQISLVQIYSAARPTPNSECGHLPLKSLSGIAQMVRESTGLRVDVF